MLKQPVELAISIRDNVDDEELDRLTRKLREEIEGFDVEQVGLASGGQLPPGAKGDPVTIGNIVVSLASAGVFTGLIGLFKSWALRREGRTVTLKAKVADREVELVYSPASTTSEEMTRFVRGVLGTVRKPEKSKAGG